MNPLYKRYIWQADEWPTLTYDLVTLIGSLAEANRRIGHLYGRLSEYGFDLRASVRLDALSADVLQTSAIEGEVLPADSVRSSLARRLGFPGVPGAPVDRRVDGVVDMVMDATTNIDEPLSRERLFTWHQSLFPDGYSGDYRIGVGVWRTDELGPMQMVSGGFGHERVHYEAPPAHVLEHEMDRFLDWVNEETPDSLLLKAGIAHLWFLTLHPFDDGNGRIARAITDWLVARSYGSPVRFFSLSGQIQLERKAYYDILERTQKGDVNITAWLSWFLEMLIRSLDAASGEVDRVVLRQRCWQQWASLSLNPRQQKVLNRLLDGFEGKLTTRKWSKLCACSPDTALRDITALVEVGVLVRGDGGGRSTHYLLVPPPPTAEG